MACQDYVFEDRAAWLIDLSFDSFQYFQLDNSEFEHSEYYFEDSIFLSETESCLDDSTSCLNETFNSFFDNDPEIGSFSDFDLKWNELTSILNPYVDNNDDNNDDHSLGDDDLFYSLTSVDKSYLHLSSKHTWGASSYLDQSQASLTDQSGEVLASSKDKALIYVVSCHPDSCNLCVPSV